MPKPPRRSARAKTLVRLYTKLQQGYEQHKHCHILRLKHLFCLLRVPSMGLGFWACSRGFFEVDLALGGGGIIDLDSTLRNRTSIESNWVKSGGLILFFIIFIFDSDYKYEFEICQERGKWIVQELFCDSKKWSASRGDPTIQKKGDSSDVLVRWIAVESRWLTATILSYSLQYYGHLHSFHTPFTGRPAVKASLSRAPRSRQGPADSRQSARVQFSCVCRRCSAHFEH